MWKWLERVKRAIRAEEVVRWELRWTGAIARLWLYSVQLLRSDINPLLQILKYQPSHRLQARNLQKNCGWGSLISKLCDRCAGTIRRYQLLAIVVSTQLYTTLLLRSSSRKTRYSTKSEKAQNKIYWRKYDFRKTKNKLKLFTTILIKWGICDSWQTKWIFVNSLNQLQISPNSIYVDIHIYMMTFEEESQ